MTVSFPFVVATLLLLVYDMHPITRAHSVRWLHAEPNETLSPRDLVRHPHRAVVQLSPGLTMEAASRFAHRLDGMPHCNLSMQVKGLPDRLGAAWSCVEN